METLVPMIVAGVACLGLFLIKDIIGGKGALIAAVLVVGFILFGGGFVENANTTVINGATDQAKNLFDMTGFDGALNKIRGH